MAYGKNSFVLYTDLLYTVEKMPLEKAGELFLHILRYVNDEEPETDDLIVNLTFEPIKQQLKRDLRAWEKKQEQRRQAGLRSAEVRRENSTTVNDRSTTVNNPSISLGVNGNVNGNGNVNVNYKEVVDLWNTMCSPPLPKVEKITQARKNKIKPRITEMGGRDPAMGTIKQIFKKVNQSDFLKGDNPRGWQVTFDWIFENGKNWLKIIEGNYDNKKKGYDPKNPNSQPKKWEEF
jgi:hypothetical protein